MRQVQRLWTMPRWLSYQVFRVDCLPGTGTYPAKKRRCFASSHLGGVHCHYRLVPTRPSFAFLIGGFFPEGMSAAVGMMLFLPVNILHDFRDMRWADGDGAIAGLPSEMSLRFHNVIDQCRRSALDGFHDVGHIHDGSGFDENMNMVGHSIDRKDITAFVSRCLKDAGKQTLFQFRREQLLAVLSRPHDMEMMDASAHSFLPFNTSSTLRRHGFRVQERTRQKSVHPMDDPVWKLVDLIWDNLLLRMRSALITLQWNCTPHDWMMRSIYAFLPGTFLYPDIG
jgi:hypothetical protein